MGNQVTSSCELHSLDQDDEIHNVNDEPVEEEQLEREEFCVILLMQKSLRVSPGMSVEVVPVVVDIKTLKKRLIDCTQVLDRVVVVRGRGEESRNEE